MDSGHSRPQPPARRLSQRSSPDASNSGVASAKLAETSLLRDQLTTLRGDLLRSQQAVEEREAALQRAELALAAARDAAAAKELVSELTKD